MQFGRYIPTIRRNLLSPSTGYKHWHASSKLHAVTSRKTGIASNLIYLSSLWKLICPVLVLQRREPTGSSETSAKLHGVTCKVGRVAQSAYRLATGWTVRGSNPGRGRDFPHLSRPNLGPTRLLYNGYRVFPGGKERPGRDTDPSSPSSAVVIKG